MIESCPRCRVFLSERRSGSRAVRVCRQCEGVWLAARELDAAALVAPGSVEAVAALPCAVCTDPMRPGRFGATSGVEAQVCMTHGVWLDGDDIVRLAAFVHEAGIEQARPRAVEQRVLSSAFEPLLDLLGSG